MASYAIRDIYQKIKKSSLTIVFVNTRAQAELVFNKLWQENDNNFAKKKINTKLVGQILPS